MPIAVTGCRRRLPPEFPVTMAENAGNMIHGNAPFEMFDDCFSQHEETWRAFGEDSWRDFVNKRCSHLVVTLANSFKVGDEDSARYDAFAEWLEQWRVPVVVFGLGIQAPSDREVEEGTLPPGAVRMMQALGRHCSRVGVRGELTARAFRHFAGVENTYVTGCPSLFSRPSGLADLRAHLDERSGSGEDAAPVGRPSINVTNLRRPEEERLLHTAVREDAWLVEPVNGWHHRYFLRVARGEQDVPLPKFLRGFEPAGQAGPRARRAQVARYYGARYRLFRQTEPWYDFNRELVSFTYGTRFHTNMASVLAGRPALWVDHDARTRELTRSLHLPSIELAEVQHLSPAEVEQRLDYTDFFAHLPGLFERFNAYLRHHGLPEVAAPQV